MLILGESENPVPLPLVEISDEDELDDDDTVLQASTSFSSLEAFKQSTKKRKKGHSKKSLQDHLVDVALNFLKSNGEHEDNHCDLLGRLWATKLKALNPSQRIDAERAITDIFLDLEAQKLNMNIHGQIRCDSTSVTSRRGSVASTSTSGLTGSTSRSGSSASNSNRVPSPTESAETPANFFCNFDTDCEIIP